MAALIEKHFCIDPQLVEGHGGIFELTVNGTVLYTNHGACGMFPNDREIIRQIAAHTGIEPLEADTDEAEAPKDSPCCSWKSPKK